MKSSDTFQSLYYKDSGTNTYATHSTVQNTSGNKVPVEQEIKASPELFDWVTSDDPVHGRFPIPWNWKADHDLELTNLFEDITKGL